MAGLGLGNLVGGALADRLGPRRLAARVRAVERGLGLYAWSSLWLLYDVYRRFVERLDGALAMVAFHFLLLAVPTTLMGLSLPLLARGVVASTTEIAPLVGRLYAVNTLGAAAGAAIAGWWLMGELGFVATVRVAASLNLAAAVLVLLLWWRWREQEPAAIPAASTAPATSSSTPTRSPSGPGSFSMASPAPLRSGSRSSTSASSTR